MPRERLGSRLGFILLSAGCAIGVGNVWKFPWMVGQYGGGAFVVCYVLFLLILGLPIMTMEFAIGRASQKSPVRAYQALEKMCIRDRCMPGDNVEMDVELITPIAIEEGLRFAIREGGRTVGSVVVTTINA